MGLELKKFIFFGLLILFLLSGCAGGLSRRESAKLYYNLGNAYLELGDTAKASESYLKALEYNKNMKIASFNLAKAYMEVEKYSEAIGILDGMLKEEPENTILLSAKAYCVYRFGNYEKASELYDDVLKIDPGNMEALYNSAVISIDRENYSAALDSLTLLKAKKIEDDSLLTKINSAFGETYYRTEQYSEAIKYLDLIRQTDPDDISNLTMLFNSYLKTRYFASVAETGTMILKKQPENKEILFNMASVYLNEIEDTEKGLTYLEKALAAGFDDKIRAEELASAPDIAGKERIYKILQNAKLLDD